MKSQLESGDRSGSQLDFGISSWIERWLQGTASPPDPNCNLIAKRRREHDEMAIPSSASSGTAQRSRSRSTSPAKTTTALRNLDKPVRFPAMADNAVAQLPADVRGLYKHVRNTVVHHEAFMPLSIRDDIDSAAGFRHRKAWFYHDAGMPEVDTRPLDSDAAQDDRQRP